ncbi:MAG: hypothetical protein KDB53_09975 [Planctomycetes bacterium]|nr:hypothetical protein [Planctomycetota bacterium]
MLTTTYSAGFWQTITRLRSSSRLILSALEHDDVDEVERLSRAAERDMAIIRPVIEARADDPDRNPEDAQLAEMVAGLKDMNDRILEVLAEKRRETLDRLGELRSNRLRLAHYRPEDQGSQVIDRKG